MDKRLTLILGAVVIIGGLIFLSTGGDEPTAETSPRPASRLSGVAEPGDVDAEGQVGDTSGAVEREVVAEAKAVPRPTLRNASAAAGEGAELDPALVEALTKELNVGIDACAREAGIDSASLSVTTQVGVQSGRVSLAPMTLMSGGGDTERAGEFSRCAADRFSTLQTSAEGHADVTGAPLVLAP